MGPAAGTALHQNSPGGIPRLLVSEKLAQRAPSSHVSAKILAQRARKQHYLPILGLRGELFRAHAHTGPSRATNIARRTQKHGDIETNNTTAHPQQGTYETRITSAPEHCTKNAHFSPAKAMSVSIPHRHQRAKAIGVSDNQATWPTGPGCGARERRQDLDFLKSRTQFYWVNTQ